ncbi:efflux RND transporter periplasmic adaptor subunit [Magnetospirillum sulfuroxidans]|uniref:Efflux RND transporter periplasmic adaptor subunit n=1 Tax=Magnetospirillum sulfuroxidans TaxID=611300 RepID=A0ABS5IBQ1_9PROT|nr:efflux RND transporter periplasmic adaptor subunit [Magnetospirillum sulfuroxidans]MBR9971852.1 efflux RND transporter periplasmic adaptor subunit [Magnetospirillum sulfuroxidans]
MGVVLSKNKLWLAGVAVTVIVVGGGLAVSLNGHVAKATQSAVAAPPPLPVSVAVVESRDMVAWEEFSGRLEAVERVELRSRVAGQVQAVHFREGGLVKKGDLLVTIDPAPFAAEVARAEAQLASAQARLTFTQREHDRARQLTGSGNMPVRELDTRANAYAEAQASVRVAQAALQSARLDLGYSRITAPISGRIGKAQITAGNLVPAGAGAPVLATLVSVSPIHASFDADEQVVTHALADLKGGAVDGIPVRMQVGGHETSGSVQMIDNTVDVKSGTVQVRAIFANDDGALIPGQFARLSLGQPQSRPVLLVSERAIGTDQDKKYVLVVGADNKALYRQITLGSATDGLRVVTSGLQPGERIVVNGLQRLRPGAVVAPHEVAMLAKNPDALAQR